MLDHRVIYQEMFFNKLIYIDDAFDYEIYESEGNEKFIFLQ